jgi:uncharacterized GH25 family protein
MRITTTFARCALAASVLLSLGAQAHTPWLLPSSTVLSKGEWITVDAGASTGVFISDHAALPIDGVKVTAPDGSTLAPENALRGKVRSVFDLNLTQTGTYRVALVNAGVFASYKDKAGQTKRLRGTAESLERDIPADATDVTVTQSAGRVETFVTVGKPSTLVPSNQGLELVPVTHPNDLAKGEAATFAFQIDGKPAAGLQVVVMPGGSRYRDAVGEIKATTDANGRFSITWPTAGVYAIEAGTRDSKTTIARAKERRLSYSGTLEVLP